MRYLFVYNIAYFFRLHRLELAKKILAEGHDVYLITSIEQGKDKELFESYGIKVFNMDLPRGYDLVYKNITTAIKLKKYLKEIDADIVEAASIKPVILMGLLSIYSNQKILFWLPGLGYVFTSQTFFSKLIKSVVKKIYKLIFSSTNSIVLFENKEDMKEFLDSGILRIGQGRVLPGSCVDMDKIEVTSENTDDFQVVLIARMLWNKGVLEFVEAAKILRLKGVNARFLLVGMTDDNPSSISLDKLNTWQSEGYIEYLGFVEDMSKVFQDANLICLPSHREGLPKTIVEAGAYQRASVVTNVVGCREIIIDGYNGLLVEPFNSADLANKLDFLIQNNAERFLMAKNAHKMVSLKYSFQFFYDQISKIYQELDR